MIQNRVRSHGFVLLGVGIFLSHHAAAAHVVVGSGEDASYVVIESPNAGLRSYEVRYDYDDQNPLDGYDLLFAVDAADATISFGFLNFGVGTPNYIVAEIATAAGTETNTGADPYVPYWVHWVAGGEAGFPTAAPVADGSWSLGSGVSSPYRVVEPGSWDALSYSDGSSVPNIVPVPEPGGLCLMAGAGLVLVRRRRLD